MTSTVDVAKSVWGPDIWRALHTMSFIYPERATLQQRQAAAEWLGAVGALLPCDECASSWHVETIELSRATDRDKLLAGRDALSRYLVRVHNRVNVRLGKPCMSYEQVRRSYSSRGRGGSLATVLLVVAALVLAVLVLLALGLVPPGLVPPGLAPGGQVSIGRGGRL